MELGNMAFGNSRGNYEIPRGVGFEEELSRLFDAYAPDRDNSWREYGIEFENDTFLVFPYYWGDCTCGYEEADQFNEPHLDTCYQTELEKEKIKSGWVYNKQFDWLEPPKDWSYEKKDRIEREIYIALCKKYKLDYPYGCAVHCTCDFDTRYQKYLDSIGYPEGHKKECLLRKPNFLYKPMEFEIQWYKYPLRDSYMSHKISLEEFKQIIDKCIESIK